MKTLILDIETAPNIADVWDLWNQNVSLNQLRQASYTLCWAAKWRDEDEVMFSAVWRDEEFVDQIHFLLEQADVVVTYNGDRFDIPTLNKEMVLSGLVPPAPYKSVDIYKTIKSKFRFTSSKLDFVAKQLGVGSKVKHEGHELWVKVMAGESRAQLDMEEYCKGDVTLLEKVLDQVEPWISGLPNMALYNSLPEDTCPRCGAYNLTRRGYSYTLTGKYQRYQCGSCGGWSKDTKRLDGYGVASL